MGVGVAGMDVNAVKQTPMPLQSQKPMPGMAMDTIHTTLATTILVKEKLRLSHNHGMDMVDITILANDLLKPKLIHGEDTTVDGVDMDMEDMVKFVYHEDPTSMN